MKARIFTEQEKEILRHAYVDEGKSLKACAELIHSYDKAVRQFLVEDGIEIRAYAKNRKSVDREKVKNKTYFAKENENPNMAWLLGFLASDGTVSKTKNAIKIGLSAKDREILEKIKEELALEESHVTSYTTQTGFDVVELSWTCAQHKQDLARYGIVPNKTFCLGLPTELAEEYQIDYVRGYFDGDGTVTMNGNTKSLKVFFTSATKAILEFIRDVLERHGVPSVSVLCQVRNRVPIYTLDYSTNATKKIFQVLYTPNSLFLQRKYDKFIECLKRNDINFQETTHLHNEDEKLC